MSNNKSGGSSVGFFGLLQIAFIVLKLCNVITWNWWLVFMPTFAGIVLSIALLGFIFGREGITFKEVREYLTKKRRH